MQIFAREFLAAGVFLAFMVAGASAADMKDSGSIEATYVKRDMHPIDQDRHVLVLSDSKGTSKNPGGNVDGFAVTIRDFVDLTQGSGPQHGYVIYSDGADQQIVKIDGAVTTEIKDGRPDTKFKGTWVIVKGAGRLEGARGEGTYSGYFTAEDAFHVDWQGQTTKLKMTENAN